MKKINLNNIKIRIQTVFAERSPRSHADSAPVGGTRGIPDDGAWPRTSGLGKNGGV